MTKGNLASWTIESGSWTLHSAQEDAQAQGTAPGKESLRADHSPNFYSLCGKGTAAIITSGYDFYDHYTLQAAVLTTPGEAGVVFHYRSGQGYYAFTVSSDRDLIRPLVVKLFHVNPGPKGERRELGTATMDLVGPQWIMLRVNVGPSRMQCWVDHTRIFDIAEDTGLGGKFGLYADSSESRRFDDVTMRSNLDLDLTSVENIRFHTRAANGALLTGSGNKLTSPASSKEQWLALGCPRHPPHVFSARFADTRGSSGIGLIAGYRGADQPYFRFIRELTPRAESFRLEAVESFRTNTLEAATIARNSKGKTPDAVTLMADGTEEGQLRLYRDGELVLIFLRTPL